MARIELLIFFIKKQWWAQVIVAPEDSKITEFNRGIPIGIKVWILRGGQFVPNSILGVILLWKKAQKNLLKNMISEIINIIILYFINFIEVLECPPKKDDSCFTSFHHKKVAIVGKLKIVINPRIELLFNEKVGISIKITYNKATDIIKGQGLKAGMKNGFLILIIFFINGLRLNTRQLMYKRYIFE